MPITNTTSGDRILIAVDGSEPSHWATEVGNRLARQLTARILLLNVIEPEAGMTESAKRGQRRDAERYDEGMASLERARATLAGSLDVTLLQRSGPPADEIVASAKRWHADLIVMGTRGRGRLTSFVLGSTAEKVIRESPCPVITVSHPPVPNNPSDDRRVEEAIATTSVPT